MDWSHNTIWFDQLPDRDVISVDFANSNTIAAEPLDARYVQARRFKSNTADFTDFRADDSVEYLELVFANVRSFRSISALGNVRRLEMHYCLKLESDVGLSEISESLQWLHINRSKKFQIGPELLGLSRLRVLCLNSCDSLPNLKFLDRFPHLVDFRFVDTNVLDGDLSPILHHPTLCSAGFLNKRHYNMRSEEIESKLASRRAASIAIVRMEPYETYRYTAIDV